MKKWTTFAMLALLLLQITGCTHSNQHTQENLKAEVERLGNRAEQAFLAGDIDTMLEYYDENIVSMPHGHPMIRGKHNLKLQTQAIIASPITFQSLTSTTQDVQDAGQYVYEIGTFTQTITLPPNPDPQTSDGKYLTIWKRRPDGSLKIAVEMYNTTSPQ